MIYLPDTHALVWYLTGDKRLGVSAKAAPERVDDGDAGAVVSVLVLGEVLYLNEKRRIKISVQDIRDVLEENENFQIVPLTWQEIVLAQEIKRVPELFDRMIAATAKRHGAVLLSRDHVFANLEAVETLW